MTLDPSDATIRRAMPDGMRVLLICYTLESGSGSANKIVNMASEWERHGHSVWLATMRSTWPISVAEAAAGLRERPRTRSLPERIRGEAAFRLLYPSALLRACTRLGIDVIYSRELAPAPGLRALIRATPFVLEINGDVSRETNAFRRVSRLRARRLQLQRADGVVFVSRELQRACKPEPRRSLVLANPCLPATAGGARPARPTLVMVGYAKHDWSGMDKVALAAEALSDLDFVVIGAQLRGPENLRCYGPLAQLEADRVMAGCTVGLGPLALHRKGMNEASPLKSRNYLALGLPIIQAYEDTDLTEADDCILQLPNREDNVLQNLERIREFAWRAYRDPSLTRRALELGSGRLSLAAKERERLAFIASCLHGRKPAQWRAA